jgi:hypothetical protein
MGEGLGIPQQPDDVTPAWLTEALHEGGALDAATKITALTRDELSAGVGFIGIVLRLTPTYEGDAAGAPESIIAKMPSPDPAARQLAAMYGLYERELQFYRRLAPKISFRTARCYYSDGDAETVSYIILLQDLALAGQIGDQIAGCDLNQATAAIVALARHHAQWWASPKLDDMGLDSGADLVRGAIAQAYGPSYPLFLERFGNEFLQDVLDIIPTLGPTMLTTLDEIEEGPMTLAHGDYRADNLFFCPNGDTFDVAAIDWQSPNKGWGAYDLAYFICGSFATELRHQHEASLRDLYYHTLTSSGVTDYAREQFDIDYARSLLAYLLIFVINGATLDTANERGEQLFRSIFERLNASIAETNALSYLPRT